ncbi:DUF2169 domain-containing protein [Massilia sp. W12]|uniref:DUF2169 family type VI secretion system accessory protein n=1 Tax=Massilia sp. W12 TaxID=3126507 RepID=UPI0030CFEAA3
MKIIKPQTLGVLYKPYQFQGRNMLVVSALGFFRLGQDNPRFLTENLQWPHVVESLPAGMVLDEVMPKRKAEALLLGCAHAPDKKPVPELTVRMALAGKQGRGIAKCLRVIGERIWQAGKLGSMLGPLAGMAPAQISAPQPFVSMPLDYSRAFGGPNHPINPAGRGFHGVMFTPHQGLMHNLEYPQQSGDWQRTVPASFGPIDISHAPRMKKFGTYKQQWLERSAPGFADDIDWSVFNQAAPDQWMDAYFEGGESYCLQNLHPQHAQLTGALPRLQARAFIMQYSKHASDVQRAREVRMQADTVWFLPQYALGILIYHGEIEIADCDGLDVAVLMAAYEHCAAPKSLQHYLQVMALRLDPATRAQHALNESQLAPEYDAAELARRAAVQHQAEQEELAKRQRQLDQLDADFWRQSGQDKPADHQPPQASLPPLGLISAQAVQESDFDLSGMLDKARALAASAKADAEQRMQGLQDIPKPPAAARPAQELEAAQLAHALERANQAAYDLLPPGEAGQDPRLVQMLQRLEQMADLDPRTLQQARAAAQQAAPMQRQARQAAPQIAADIARNLPLPAKVAQQLGQQARLWLAGGISLAGRDLAGADLRGAKLSGADLREIMLEGADLRGADLRHCKLSKAVLTGAQLDEADFSGADLQQANLSLSRAHRCNFSHANLQQAFALEADWRGADLRHANLFKLLGHKIQLQAAVLDAAQVSRATLAQAQAAGSSWRGALMEQTILQHADLSGAQCQQARLHKTVLVQAQLQNSNWQEALWLKVQGAGFADWSGANLSGVQARECGLREARFINADMRGAAMLRCDFGMAALNGAQLDGGIFSGSIFMHANLRAASALGADFYQCQCRKADFSQAQLQGASFAACEMSGMKGADGLTDQERRAA